MPEGDTIWRTAAALRSRLAGKRVRSAEPQTLRRLEGDLVTAVEPVGKHLFIRFDSGLSLHTHMRMTGSWHLYQPGEPWGQPARLARAVLRVDDAVAVLFSTPVVELVREPASRTGHLGPDILAAELDAATIVARARALGPAPWASCCSTSALRAASATSRAASRSGSGGSTPGRSRSRSPTPTWQPSTRPPGA